MKDIEDIKYILIKPFIKIIYRSVIGVKRFCNYFAQYTEPFLVKRRLCFSATSAITGRFYRLRRYQNQKIQKNNYRQNMELMVQLSDKNNIPQHHLGGLFNNYDCNTVSLSYYDKDYVDGLIKDIRFYSKEIKNDIKSFFEYIREKNLDIWWEEMKYEILEFLLIDIRGKTYYQKNIMLNKWQAIKFIKKQRVRREKQFKKLYIRT